MLLNYRKVTALPPSKESNFFLVFAMYKVAVWTKLVLRLILLFLAISTLLPESEQSRRPRAKLSLQSFLITPSSKQLDSSNHEILTSQISVGEMASLGHGKEAYTFRDVFITQLFCLLFQQ